MTAHWGIPDPAAAEGTEEEKRRAFSDALSVMKRRIDLFASLPLEKLNKLALQEQLRDIGHQ
jgi:arsenate reductase